MVSVVSGPGLIAGTRSNLPVNAQLQRLQAIVYATDSTIIDLNLKLSFRAHFRRRKAAVKAHALPRSL